MPRGNVEPVAREEEPLLSLGESLGESLGDDDGDDHEALTTLLNDAVSQIGMGPYQWALFGLCGMGAGFFVTLNSNLTTERTHRVGD